MSLTVPVALLIFNRPDLTEIVFQAIAKVKPAKLLVVADGPRSQEEAVKCQQARAVIEKLDWECDVLTRYSNENLGCGVCVSSGLDWVFREVEEAIILEDDILPSHSFFRFCEELLEYYRHDERIMQISGTNVQGGISRTGYSYYFSKFNHCWGWATWRRAWKYYDYRMKTWPEFKQIGMTKLLWDDAYEEAFWTSMFDDMSQDSRIDTWDYQWNFAFWSQGGLAILPNANLTSNLGFRPDATHTLSDLNSIANLPTLEIGEMRHPPFVVRNREADIYTFNHVYGGNGMRKAARVPTLKEKIRYRLSSMKR